MSGQILSNFKRDKFYFDHEINRSSKLKSQIPCKEAITLSGTSLLKQIQCKNKALKQHISANVRSRSNNMQQQHPNYLTFCQKYAGILLEKYNNKEKISFQTMDSSKKSNKKLKKTFGQNSKFCKDQSNMSQHNNLLSQKQVETKLIYIKISFEDNFHRFDNSHNELNLKVSNLKQKYYPKIYSLMQKAENTQRQLTILELFMSKMMKKVNKKYVTPFTVFLQQVQKTINTPVKNKVKRKLQLSEKVSSIKKQEKQNNIQSNIDLSSKIYIKPQRSSNKQAKMHISHMLTPKSPNLLSGYPSSQSRDNSHLLISFKKNTQQSENGFQTLKYSQSDFSNSKRGQQSNNKRHLQPQNQQGEESSNDQIFELPYSPVQPYRIQTILKDIKRNKIIDSPPSKHREEVVDEIQIDFKHLQLNNQLIEQEIECCLKNTEKRFIPISQQATTIQNQVFQAIDSFGRVLQKVEYSFQCERMQSNGEWNQILQLLGQDLSNMQACLSKQKENGQIRNQSILKKLQKIQNNLIEDLFAEKQERKQQQEILSKTLNQLVDNLESIL